MISIFSNKSDYSRMVLYGDSLYCIAIGLVLALFSAPLAGAVGLSGVLIPRLVGIALIVWGFVMGTAAYSDRVRNVSLLAIAVKVGTLVAIEALIMTSMVPTTLLARMAVIMMVGVVGVFIVAQYVGFKRLGA